ncbi:MULTISPECIES: DUF7681 family protein [Aeromonas]|uniref:Acb2/Tad1 hairpin domain-containing protein n=1 Tax=Aeromonas veronii TaxID=654 RepID=A0AAX2UP31_AERVE|nr:MULTISPECIES: hypothetical protein [Aeromonas]MDD9227897.1 hypothetical protein [Aeromonas hydrophila]QWZ66359.1 hypothetical protein I6L47_22175 [Aeromonas sp. FDAARGOS 1417]TND51870.1 hypothetical protein CF123_18550 [Aeromonas veronii]BEE07068.1 hypothetical protein VAWG002_42640 [Aeromonas veronii]
MNNQHKMIRGYRDLTQFEVDLMNEIKAMEVQVIRLHRKVLAHIETQDHLEAAAAAARKNALGGAFHIAPEPSGDVIARHRVAEPRRWAAIAKTDLETAFMAMTRAVAQPVHPELLEG